MRVLGLLLVGLMACTAHAQQFEVQRLEPGPAGVAQFSKMEWGIKLPFTLKREVETFLKEGFGGVNPFNPVELDMGAVVQIQDEANTWQSVDTVHAFYYEDFRRSHPINKPAASYTDNASDNHYGLWNWKRKPNAFPFRLRYAPRSTGNYRVRFYLRADNTFEESAWETFEVAPSTNPGYVQRAPDRPYLQYADGTLFFPIGHNDNPLDAETDWKLSYAKNKETGEYCCEACVESEQPWGRTQWSSEPMALVSFAILEDHLHTLARSGANTLRIIGRPYGFELEYEQLGNYSGRMHIGWELDRLIDLAEELGVKIQFCMDDQYSFEIDQSYKFYQWDWYDNYAPGKSSAKNKGYCYHTDLGLGKPIEFLTDETAKEWYKNRLRYYYARWGYSTTISAFELLSEVNGYGKSKQGPNYPDNPELQRSIADWQAEMARYVKNELRHTWHLFGVSYLIDGARGADYSYEIPEVDLHCESHYFTTFHDHVNLGSRTNALTTPLLWTEYGFGDVETECSRPVNAIKCALLTPFTGVAGMGMHWDNQFNVDTSHWAMYAHVDGFMRGLDLHQSDWEANGDVRPDDLASTTYLLTGNARTGTTRAVGVVYNHTWNEYSTRGCPENCKVVPEKCRCDSLRWNAWNIVPKLREPVTVAFQSKNKTRLEVTALRGQWFKRRTLYIRWYSPFTGEYSEVQEVRRKWGGRVELAHPDLDPEVNPALFFELWGDGVDGVR